MLFGDPLTFKKVGQTIPVNAYLTFTLPERNEAYTLRYSMSATLTEGSTGGPMGSAMEYGVNIGHARIVEKTARPAVEAGKRAILPGELVVVPSIPKEKLEVLDDRYLIELPNVKVAKACFRAPGFRAALQRVGGSACPRKKEGTADEEFELDGAGPYEVRVMFNRDDSRPKSLYYLFYVYFGERVYDRGVQERAAQAFRSAPSVKSPR